MDGGRRGRRRHGPGAEWVLAAIAAGKHVVTAKRRCWPCTAARSLPPPAYGVAVAYEGRGGGEHPDREGSARGLTANRIEWVAGIINSTTNFILSKMRDEGVGFAQALAQTQALGYAEADPTFDIEGIDAAHKITLLAANALHAGAVCRRADRGHHRAAGAGRGLCEQLGFRIKLLAWRGAADTEGVPTARAACAGATNHHDGAGERLDERRHGQGDACGCDDGNRGAGAGSSKQRPP